MPMMTSSDRKRPSVAVVWIQRCRSRGGRRRVLGDVGRRAAVLAAERQALQQAQATRMIGASQPIVA
jgi:hypothetical protein